MKTIVCPLDNSQIANYAYCYGKALSWIFQADLQVIKKQVLPDFFSNTPVTEAAVKLSARQGTLQKITYSHHPMEVYAAGVSADSEEAVSTESISQIANFALEQKADLIVVGAGENCSLRDVFNGPISYFHTQAKCPVLVVPEGEVFKSYNRIVVVIDHEVNISRHTAFLVEMASRFDAEILFLQTAPDSDKKAAPYFDCMMELYLSFPYAKTTFYALQHAFSPESIQEFAESKKAELLIMLPALPGSSQTDAPAATLCSETDSSRITVPVLALQELPAPVPSGFYNFG